VVEHNINISTVIIGILWRLGTHVNKKNVQRDKNIDTKLMFQLDMKLQADPIAGRYGLKLLNDDDLFN